ncbi:unnamed protein product [Ectocarpus sp. 12 AP-2014]
MSHNTIGAMGDMAKGFVTGEGGFDGKGVYNAHQNPHPNDAFAFDSRTLNTQAALNGALAFGGGVLPQGTGMMAGTLPAALKIQEHKQMREVADYYYAKYIKDFNRKYGFSEEQIKDLIEEFEIVTGEISRLIPDEQMREMYEKYIESYPTMYLSMIPAEALQTKLAVRCVTENGVLRKKIEDMSSCVSSLVKNLTDLQISAGIPPIVNLMFESMPDPLTAITDPMYHKYNDAIVTYHKLLKDEDETLPPNYVRLTPEDPKPNSPKPKRSDLLRLEPVHFLNQIKDKGDRKFKSDTDDYEVKQKDIEELATVMENMQNQSGCQPFGEEWNHQGPTPPMNPAMCLDVKDRFQPGNPRHNEGRTQLFQAKRDQNGNAHWVQSGEIPALSAGGPQMVQHQPQLVQQPNQWGGMSHMPGVDPRPIQQQQQPFSQHISQQPLIQRPSTQPPVYVPPPVQAGQFNQQFVGSGGGPRSGPKTPWTASGKKKQSSRATAGRKRSSRRSS